LFEADDNSESSSPDNVDFQDDIEIDRNVEKLADNIVKDLAEKNDFEDVADGRGVSNPLKTTGGLNVHTNSVQSDCRPDNPKEQDLMAASASFKEDIIDDTSVVLRSGEQPQVEKNVEATFVCGIDSTIPVENFVEKAGVSRKRCIKSTTVSSEETLSFRSGPWSVDWLQNIQQGDISLISSNNKRLRRL
jgi:hypothetical protein